MPSSSESITRLLHDLRRGDGDAARRLWNVYYQPLVTVARKKLFGIGRLIDDEEDVALNAFKSFCRGIDEGRFQDISDRNELWGLLIAITMHKVLHVARDAQRLKRGGNQEFAREIRSESGWIDLLPGDEPDPARKAEVQDEFCRLFDLLSSSDLVELAVLKLEGFTNQEIALRWNRAERTVERKLKLIRKLWEGELDGA